MADITYLDRVAAIRAGQDCKRDLLTALAPQPDHTVLDVGCGPGTDLPALAALAATTIGVDHDPTMVAEARRPNTCARFLDLRPERVGHGDLGLLMGGRRRTRRSRPATRRGPGRGR
jgi:protein-L-isoaspartate O-methyltransferase